MGLADLTPDQRKLIEKIEANKPEVKQLQMVTDIADMVQEVIRILDDKKPINEIGSLLLDMRESLSELNKKEAPEIPDHAKPVVEGIKRLETALTDALKKIDVKPIINPPPVNVSTPSVSVDLKGVERIVKDIPKAFDKAIKSIPKTEIPEDDYTPLLEKLTELGAKLDDIDTGVRMKPQPGSIKVSNLQEVSQGISQDNPKYAAFQFDPDDSAPIYIGKNVDPNAVNNDSDWVIYKFTYSGSNVTSIIKKTGSWTNRATL